MFFVYFEKNVHWIRMKVVFKLIETTFRSL